MSSCLWGSSHCQMILRPGASVPQNVQRFFISACGSKPFLWPWSLVPWPQLHFGAHFVALWSALCCTLLPLDLPLLFLGFSMFFRQTCSLRSHKVSKSETTSETRWWHWSETVSGSFLSGSWEWAAWHSQHSPYSLRPAEGEFSYLARRQPEAKSHIESFQVLWKIF